MGHDDEDWKRFTMTGRVEDYLRYRLDDMSEADKRMLRADNDVSAIDKEMRDGRDVYGDGDGPIGTARG